MVFMRKITFIALVVAMAVSCLVSCCGNNAGKDADDATSSVKFPALPSVPSTLSDPSAAATYVAQRYWNKFFSQYRANPTDSTMILGVANDDMELAMGTFASILESGVSIKDGQQAMKIFFDLMEDVEAENPSSSAYERLADLTEKYFYDPNSPVRSEDLYLAFVESLASSKCTDPNLVPSYKYTISMCSLNKVGTPAADFSFKDINGKVNSLYKIKAETTLLFFSNPGCPSCSEIISALMNDMRVEALVSSERLSVVNIYIDEEIDLWKDYVKTYPKTWINGYDHKYKIRNDVSYNVRAIPSLYILDADKKVIMKDATQDAVIGYLRSL